MIKLRQNEITVELYTIIRLMAIKVVVKMSYETRSAKNFSKKKT